MSTLTSLVQSQTRRIYRQLGKGQLSLGIDVGQVNTKVVSAERNSADKVIYRAVCLPTDANCSTAAPVSTGSQGSAGGADTATESDVEPSGAGFQWSTRAVKTLMERVSQVVGKNARSSRLEVGVTLSMSACDYRTLYVPKSARVSAAGMEQSISAAVGDKRPRCVALIPESESQSDTKQIKLRCFSLVEDLAWSIAQQLDGVGLTPNAINGLPWCIANALQMSVAKTEGSQLQVGIDWSYGSPTLVTVKNRKLDYVRCMSTGGLQEILTQPMSQFGMSPSEAGRWLAHCLQSPSTQQADAAANESREWARDVCTKLAAEIDIAVDFINWRNQGTKLQTLWLMGGGTQISGLAELLQSMLVCQLRPWSAKEEPNQLSAEYATAASLAWMGLQHA